MKLTKAQTKALEKVTTSWQSSYDMQVHRGTLDALHRRGLIERRVDVGYNWTPATAIMYRKKS